MNMPEVEFFNKHYISTLNRTVTSSTSNGCLKKKKQKKNCIEPYSVFLHTHFNFSGTAGKTAVVGIFSCNNCQIMCSMVDNQVNRMDQILLSITKV